MGTASKIARFGMFVATSLVWVAGFGLLTSPALGLARADGLTGDSKTEPNSDSWDGPTIPVGIDGVYRPGNWTAILRPESLPKGAVTVQTLDGDGVKVEYRQLDSTDSRWLYAVPGLPGAPLNIAELNIADSTMKQVMRSRFAGKHIEPKVPWILVLGDTLGIENFGKNELLGREASVAVSRIPSKDDFPDQSIGLSGVDLVILGPTSIEILNQFSPRQSEAFAHWVRTGGRVLVSLGKQGGELLESAPWLRDNLGLAKDLKTIRLDPSAIETFTTSRNGLPVLDAVELPPRGGQTRIAGRNTSRQPARVAIQYLLGFGRVTVVAVALDSPELADWPDRTTLITRLCDNLFATEIDSRREARSKTMLNYDDYSGQLQAALDRFESRRRIPYSAISLVLIGLVALIGPLDYFLVNRILGKPLLGWITFPLSVLAISGVLLVIGRPVATGASASAQPSGADSTNAKHGTAFINRLEIVDIDTQASPAIGRGWSWSHLSSTETIKTDYPSSVSPSLVEGSATPSTTSAPFGYPSSSFGGISIVGEDTHLPSYQVELSRGSDNHIASIITDIPLAPGGSKSIVTRWTFAPKLTGRSQLSRRRGSELLMGSLSNPLSVDLINGALVYGEWVYLLPTRLRAGQTIPNIDGLRQKNFRWLLARREALENSSRSEPWNPEMHDDLSRLLEILMFNGVAGGRDYTGLSNRPLADMDLSYALNTETAILYGHLESPALNIDLEVQRGSSSAVRIKLPVAPPRLTDLMSTPP
jgi:hypothetical protein